MSERGLLLDGGGGRESADPAWGAARGTGAGLIGASGDRRGRSWLMDGAVVVVAEGAEGLGSGWRKRDGTIDLMSMLVVLGESLLKKRVMAVGSEL